MSTQLQGNGQSPSSGKIEIVKLALQIISTTSIIFAAIGVFVAYQSYKGQHEWNRRQYTMEVLRNYDRDAKHHSDELNTYFPNALLYASEETKLTRAEAENLYRHPKLDSSSTEKPEPNNSSTQTASLMSYDDQIKRRRHLIAYLNYMEFVCKAYEAQVVDQEIIYEAFNGLFVRRFIYFEELINLAQHEQKSKDSWGPIRRVVGGWRRRNEEEESKNLKPTG